MKSPIEILSRAIVTKGLLNRSKPGDYLVLSDETLLAAIENRHPLNRTEWSALLESPITLRRFQVLAAEIGSKKAIPSASNDAFWRDSEGLLMAADSGEAARALSTEDGWWRLAFLDALEGYRMVLQLDMSSPIAPYALRNPWALLDGEGQLIVQGWLDDDGELEAPWPLASAPYPYFMEKGGRFRVRPC
ncbi:hypothetical protein [Chitinilyticum aquatile]|uniref:hypothetical protein n=1 Tax=Chitinilyticum aquatile TaxID=362520 RepID=UPI000684DBE9|nr:hypothetical protein [Chitinilyticum aquatile]